MEKSAAIAKDGKVHQEKKRARHIWCQFMYRMLHRDHFAKLSWIWRPLTWRIARRAFGAILCLLLAAAVGFRVHSYILTRRIQAVISGLSTLHIDETTEDEVVRNVPYLVHSRYDLDVHPSVELGNVEKGLERFYYVEISNEQSWMRFESFAWRFSSVESTKDGQQKSWIFTVASLLGYRYISFSASVELLNGKVSSIAYGIADDLVFPQQIGNIVSVQSVHARWAARRREFEVPSTEDESPQFDVSGDDRELRVRYTPEASPVLRAHLFRVNLSCFWGLFRCDHARQVALLLWQDKIDIEAATLARLESINPCPERILDGRFRYLPDMNVLLLQSEGSENKEVNEEGDHVYEMWSYYKLIEILRGRAWESWKSVRRSTTIPYPGDYTRRLQNMNSAGAKAGEKVMVFSAYFDSCRAVLATPSALAAVRGAVPAPRRAEDEVPMGLQ